MNQSKKMIISLFSSLLIVGSTTINAEKCTSPCEVEVTGSTFGNGVLRFISELAGSGDWEIKPHFSSFTSGTTESLVISKVGDTTPQFVISGDATENTMVVGPNGNIGINTISPSEELTIDSKRPGIRLNDTTTSSVDFNLVADGNSFAIEDSNGTNILTLSTAIGSTDTIDSVVVDSSGDVNLANGSMFIDRSTNRVGIGTMNPLGSLNFQSINDSILFGDSDNGWQLKSGTDFRISQLIGGSSNKMTIKADGEIGVGTTTPESALHVKSFGAKLIVEDSNTIAGVRNVIQLKNKGGVGFEMRDTNLNNAWDFRTAGNGGFLVSNIGVAGSKLQINKDGSVFFVDAKFNFNGPTGNLTLAGNSNALQHIDTSSRDAKTDFEKVDVKAVMDKIKKLNVSEWRYKDKAAKGRHLGPVAEDFYSLFELGADNKHIAARDLASIALIAAKELQKENAQLKQKIQFNTIDLKTENSKLKQRLAILEKLVMNLASDQSNVSTASKNLALK